MPGSRVLSTGPPGCNLSCAHCQNWQSSQASPPTRFIPPRELADLALKSAEGLAFTYTEPVIWYEYIMDTAPLVRKEGGVAVMVSNGFVSPEPLGDLLSVTDAWNVDLKAWSDDFYRKLCGGSMAPVLKTLKTIASSAVHLEVTYLVIPGENDDPLQWEGAGRWLAENCGEETPLHVSRYFPRHRLNRPSTPVQTLSKAVSAFRTHLRHVFPGNV